MKLFCLTDSHGLCPESRPDADLVLVCGDFSCFGDKAEGLFRQMAAWRLPVYFTSGNHETPDLCRAMAAAHGAVCLDYDWVRVGGLMLAGVGGHDLFDVARERRIAAFTRRLDGLQMNPAPAFSILLTHEPPSPWRWLGEECGRESLRGVARAWPFNLVLAGHLHEDFPRLETKGLPRPTLNPSTAGCVVEVDTAAKTFTVPPPW